MSATSVATPAAALEAYISRRAAEGAIVPYGTEAKQRDQQDEAAAPAAVIDDRDCIYRSVETACKFVEQHSAHFNCLDFGPLSNYNQTSANAELGLFIAALLRLIRIRSELPKVFARLVQINYKQILKVIDGLDIVGIIKKSRKQKETNPDQVVPIEQFAECARKLDLYKLITDCLSTSCYSFKIPEAKPIPGFMEFVMLLASVDKLKLPHNRLAHVLAAWVGKDDLSRMYAQVKKLRSEGLFMPCSSEEYIPQWIIGSFVRYSEFGILFEAEVLRLKEFYRYL